MTKYGIEDDWHLMDAPDKELSPTSIEYEVLRPIPENKSCDAHTIVQGYTEDTHMRNIVWQQALQRLTKEVFNPHDPVRSI
ncbi:hypothetical protein E4U51_008432, partial [Claviceps purpurea]